MFNGFIGILKTYDTNNLDVSIISSNPCISKK